VGALRGRPDRLQSLFVDQAYHRQGIGRRLVERFEDECRRQNATEIQCAATLYAIPFYLSMGYEKVGDVETGPCFEGDYFMWQPMRKMLVRQDSQRLGC
jgi:GNAT superfamily N-acetyltransferase